MPASQKEVFMHGAIALDKLVKDFLDFVVTKRPYVTDQIMRASRLDEEDYDSVSDAADRVLHVMRSVEEMGTGDAEGHRVRQMRMAEIASIMHIARAFPDKAVKRLQGLPAKRLVNAGRLGR
jgi:hypothetical protein